jgi:aryl-alcohol dehydrogenase-like predicted oxidoreductase
MDEGYGRTYERAIGYLCNGADAVCDDMKTSGTLSGKYSRERTSDPASSRAKYAKLDEATFAVLDVLERVSSTLCVTVAQVALAWVRQQPRVTSTLIGARTIDQLETNLASIDVDLDDAVVAELNTLTKPDLDYPWNVLPLGAGI